MNSPITLEILGIGDLILTILPVPFCLLTLFILIYYIRRRIKLYQEGKRIPAELLFKESYQNYYKNLKIKAIIANFVIIILIMELIDNISYIVYLLQNCINFFEIKNRTIRKFINQASNYNNYLLYATRASLIPVLSLLLNVLWLIYRKYQYRNTFIRWVVYILIKTFLSIILGHYHVFSSSFQIEDYKILLFLSTNFFFLFFYIIDFLQFVYFSRKFYLHLKSREKEIRLFYFDNEAYLESKLLRIHFMIANTLVVIALFFLNLGYFLSGCLGIINIIFIQVFPNKVYNTQYVTYSAYDSIVLPSMIVSKILITLNYLYVFIIVVYKFLRNRNKLQNINSNIRPIIQQYHDTFYH